MDLAALAVGKRRRPTREAFRRAAEESNMVAVRSLEKTDPPRRFSPLARAAEAPTTRAEIARASGTRDARSPREAARPSISIISHGNEKARDDPHFPRPPDSTMAPRPTVAALLLTTTSIAAAFTSTLRPVCRFPSLAAHNVEPAVEDPETNSRPSRRAFLSTAIAGPASSVLWKAFPSFADEGESKEAAPSASFESIAARAARVSREVAEAEEAEKAAEAEAEERRKEIAQKIRDDKRTIYDFSLPVGGVSRSVAELIGQEFGGGTSVDGGGGDGWTDGGEVDKVGTRVKAILVVNIKQDDPIARKNIPELIALASK